MKKISLIFAVVASLLALQGPFGNCLAGEPLAILAPVNPRFLDFMSARQQSSARLMVLQGGGINGLGYIPSPVDYSYLKGQPSGTAQTSVAGLYSAYLSTQIAQYDLRQQNKLTPVRNQGTCGSCWMFGAIGVVESILMPGEQHDF